MQPLDDYQIGPEPEQAPPPPPRDGGLRAWGVGAVVLLILAALAAFFVMRPSNEPAPPEEASAPAAAEPAPAPTARAPLGPAIDPRDLPALDLMDPVVRELLAGLSRRPELATWLASDGLVRNIAAVVDNVGRGATPAAHLRRLAPSRPFTADARDDTFTIDPRSYARYDGIGDTVASLDADGLARAYVTLRPRLEEAYRELGYPDGRIDAAVERAVAHLLATPVLERDARVQPAPVLYKYADRRLESLSAAQKQLLRMGPRNVRIVQDKLREVARALGIPEERLRSS